MIYKANEEIDEIYLIFEGSVEVGFSIQENVDSVRYVKTIKSVDYIGEFYCIFAAKSKYFYRAATEVKTFGINKEDFSKALEKHPEFLTKFRSKAYRRYVDYIKTELETRMDEEITNFNQKNTSVTIAKTRNSHVILQFDYLDDG